MHRRPQLEAPKVKHPQLAEDDLRRETLRPSRRNLVPSPHELPHPLGHILIHRPIRHQPRPIGEVGRPTPQCGVEVAHHVVPGLVIGRTEDPLGCDA